MTIYYISTAGDDANGGLAPSSAWLTPSVADANIGSADELLFNRGNTWTGGSTVEMDFTDAHIGSAGQYTTLSAYGAGPRPILDADWDNLGNFDGIINVAGAQYFLVEDLDLRHAGPESSGSNNGSFLMRFDEDSLPAAFITVQDVDLDGAWRQGCQVQDGTNDILLMNIDVTNTGNATFSGFTGGLTLGFRRVNGGSNRITNCNSSLSGSEGISFVDSQGSSSADPLIADFNYLHTIESSVLYNNAVRNSIVRHNIVTADSGAGSQLTKTAWNGQEYGDSCLEIAYESSTDGPSASTSAPQDIAYISNLVSRSLNAFRASEQDTRADMERNRIENNTFVDCATMISLGNIRTNNAGGIQLQNNSFFRVGSAAVRTHSTSDGPESNWTYGNNYWGPGLTDVSADNGWSASTDTVGSIGYTLARGSAFDAGYLVITTADFQPNISTSGGASLGHTDENGTALNNQFGGLALASNDRTVSVDPESMTFTGLAVSYVITGPPSDAQGAVVAAFSTVIQNEAAFKTVIQDEQSFRVSV